MPHNVEIQLAELRAEFESARRADSMRREMIDLLDKADRIADWVINDLAREDASRSWRSSIARWFSAVRAWIVALCSSGYSVKYVTRIDGGLTLREGTGGGGLNDERTRLAPDAVHDSGESR